MRATKLIAAILGAVALLVAALAFLADTAPGHRFIAHRIAALSPQTGLKIRIGRIDGSIYSQAEIHDLALSDPQGVFFTAPRIELDWTPLAWLNNKLDIDRLHAKTARLDRLPKLRPGKPGQPILPGFDIHIGTLAIDRLFIGAKVAGKPRIGRLSGTGWAVGYVGGILSLILVLGFLAANPDTGRTLFGLAPLFGLDPVTHQGDRITGPLTAIWFIVFVTPMFLLTPDYPAKRAVREAVRTGLSELKGTLGELPKQKSMLLFLLANMIYTDGLVSLFAFGGIYAAGTFGWHTQQIGTFGIILAIAGTLGAWLGGKLDDRLGPKRVIAGSMLVLLSAVVAILMVEKDSIFYVAVTPPQPGGALFAGAAEKAYLLLGCLIGAAGGPLQAASRTLLIRLAPKARIAQYFGLFALTGKVTSFTGPLMIGAVTAATASRKAGMSVLVIFFVAGMALLMGVQEPRTVVPDKRA